MRTLESLLDELRGKLLDENRKELLKPSVVVKCETREEIGKLRAELLDLDRDSYINIPSPIHINDLPIYVAVSPISDRVNILYDIEEIDLYVYARDIAFREDILLITEIEEGEEYKIILDDIDKESVEYSLLTKGAFKRVTYNLEELVSAENETEELIEYLTMRDILKMKFVKVTNASKMIAFTMGSILSDTYLVRPLKEIDLYTFERLTKLDSKSEQYEFTDKEIDRLPTNIQQMIDDGLLTVIDSVLIVKEV